MAHTTISALNQKSQFLPDNLVTKVWQELTRATNDRHHEWRTPALASIGVDGTPQVRSIVLRHADPALWTLQAYTDSRSPKYQELITCGRAQLMFWSKRRRWQLRVTVEASVHNDGKIVDIAWSRMHDSKSSKDYLSHLAPGSVIAINHVNKACSSRSVNNHYLAVLCFQVVSMDWLELGKDLHRRAHIDSSGIVTPLIP